MNKGAEIKIGAILSYVVIILNMIIGIAYTPFLTKMLGQSEYGLYSLVASVISYLTVLDLGFGNAIIIYTSKFLAKNDKKSESNLHGMFFIIYTIIGIIAGIMGTILYLSVDKMFGQSMNYEEIHKAKILMAILTFNLIITFPFSIFSSIITAYEKFIFRKCLNIIRIIIMPIIMIPLLLLGYKSITLAVLTTTVNAICLITNMLYCLKKLNIKLKFNGFDLKLLKEIFAYSFFIFLNSIIDKINWNVDNFILGTVSGTVAVAVYAVAAQFNTMYLSFSTAISGVLLPKVAKMEAQNSSDKEFTDIFIRTGRIQYIIMALIITGFILFGKFFIITLFGKEYEQAYYIACILMIPVTVPLIQNVGLNIIQAKNKYKFRTIVFFFIAIFNVLLSIPLAKQYGGIGTAIGTSIALVVGQIIIINIYYQKKIHIDIISFWKEILKMTIPVIFTFIIGIGINKFIKNYSIMIFAFKIVIYTIIYMLLMWHLGMKEEERKMFKKPINKFLSMMKGNKKYDTN